MKLAKTSKAKPDRREHDRHVKVMRVARLANEELQAEGLGLVRDVSSGGMMIDAHFALEVGQHISISLIDDQILRGEVVWKEDQTVGIHFETEIAVDDVLAKPAANIDGRRTRMPRFIVNQGAEIWNGKDNVEVEICDVSQRGAKIRCATPLSVNSIVLVKMRENRSVRATVKWCAADFAGLEFHRMLVVEELAKWLPFSLVAQK